MAVGFSDNAAAVLCWQGTLRGEIPKDCNCKAFGELHRLATAKLALYINIFAASYSLAYTRLHGPTLHPLGLGGKRELYHILRHANFFCAVREQKLPGWGRLGVRSEVGEI